MHLERDRDEHRPTVERPAADVERIVDRHRVVLHEEADRRADQAADQHDERDARAAACPAPPPSPSTGYGV